jgi:osmoprotectant transport system ATP-binding protein
VPAGEVCVLIGPSGCGKTTTMRVINRMIDPDSGSVQVAGRDLMSVDPVELRRSIGYVIQQIGSFPALVDRAEHRDRAAPARMGRRAHRQARRRALALVGHGSFTVPGPLSARAIGRTTPADRRRACARRRSAGHAHGRAVRRDQTPITRTRLQDEFLNILRSLGKTVVFVTHDIDEALKMGDRIAIMRDGALVHTTRRAILARPRTVSSSRSSAATAR